MLIKFLNAKRWAAACTLVLVCPLAAADSVEVEITGVDDPLENNVRKFLSIAAEHKTPWNAKTIRRLHARAPGEIESALQPYGYYQPVISTSLETTEESGDEFQALYEIDPGPATIISQLNVKVTGEGADNEAIQKILAETELKRGERLVHSAYKTTKSSLIDVAYDAGYLDAIYEKSEIRIRPKASEADVELLLTTGPRYFFGDIEIKQEILSDEFVRKYVKIKPGDPFDTDRLTDLQLALSDTDYFSQVEIEAERDNVVTEQDISGKTTPRLPVLVRATPRKPQKYTASAGFGTDTGPRVGLGVELRRVNRQGHQFRTDLRLSVIEQALASRYTIPIDDVARDRLAFGATIKQEELGDATSQSGVLSAAREDGWEFGRRRFYLNLERETFSFGNDETFGVGDDARTSDLFYPGATLSFQRADNTLRTRRGLSLSGDVHGGTEAIISSTDFLQGKVTAQSVLPLGPKGRLLTRAEVGATEVGDFDALPPSQRFFTGGDRSVRGYGYQEISPENADGDDIGGRYLASASIEAEYLFYGDFGAALFFDAGDSALEINEFDVKRGVGIGGRWLSPVGTLRLDFAHPLDDPDSSFRFHFSLGPDL